MIFGTGKRRNFSGGGSPSDPSDLTVNSLSYANLSIARTGTSIHLQQGASSVNKGDNLALWQDNNDGRGGGVWTFNPYTATPHNGANIPPFSVGSGSTTACVQQATNPAALINGGDLDVEVELMHAWSDMLQGDPLTGLYYTVFSATTSEGLIRLRFEWALQAYVLRVRGVDVLTANPTLYGQGQNWTRDAYWRVRAWYRPSTGECGIETSCNGNRSRRTSSTVGGALSAATSLWWGSDQGASDHADARHTLHRIHTLGDVPTLAWEGLDIGDSITAPYLYRRSRSSYLYTAAEARSRAGWYSQAIPGDTAPGQLAIFNAAPWNSLSSIKVVSIMIGANDLIASGYTGSALITNIQAIVNSVASHMPAAKIVICKMIPFYKRIEDAFPGDPVQIALVKSYYQQVQTAIGGAGGTPITGVHARAGSSYFTTLGAGTNYLAIGYDQFPTGGPSGSQEGLHPNDAGEIVIAAEMRTIYQSLGVLP